MKGLFIFAFLVLCAWSDEFPDFANYGSSSSSSGVFTPAPFDCNFQMQFTLTNSEGTYKGTYSGYGGSRSYIVSYKFSGENEIWVKYTLRADVYRYQGEPLYSIAAEFSGQKTCQSSYVPNTTQIGQIYPYVEEPFSYDRKEDGTWNGERCTVYFADDDNKKLYVKDGRVIGYVENEGTISAVIFSVNSTGKAYEEDFTIGSSFEGCRTSTYSKIEHIDTCELESKYKVFTPKAFDCSFSIDFTLNSITANYTGVYSGYGDSRSYIALATSNSRYNYYFNTLRADINGGTEGNALSSSARNSGGYYYCTDSGYVKNTTKIGLIYDYVEVPLSYDTKKNGEWNGRNCTVYFYEDDYKFYVEDDRVIGYVDDMVVFSATYNEKAYKEDFTIKKKYDDCRADAYTPITEINGCELDSRVFNISQLPCAYTVEFTLEQDDLPRKVHGYEAAYGNYLALHQEYKLRGENFKTLTLQRIDIGRKGRNMSAAVFRLTANSTTDVCSFIGFNEPYYDNIDTISPIHQIFTDNIEFLKKKTDVKFNGQKCDELTTEEGDIYYVKDGRIIGLYDAYSTGFRREYTFSYKGFEKVYEGDFIIPEEFTDCADYEEAFEAPGKVAGCKIKKGNRSAASTIKAAAVAVVITIISSLLF